MSTAKPTKKPALTTNFFPSYYPSLHSQDFWVGDKWYSTNSCVANAFAAGTSCMVYHELKNTNSEWKDYLDFSVSWIYGTPNIGSSDDGGMYYINALNALKQYGTPAIEGIKLNEIELENFQYPDSFRFSPSTINGRHYRGSSGIRRDNYSQSESIATPQCINSWDEFPAEPSVEFRQEFIDNGQGEMVLTWVIDDVYYEYDVHNIQQAIMDTTKNIYITIVIDDFFYNVGYDGIVPNRTKTTTDKVGHMLLVTGWKWMYGDLYWECQNSWDYSWGYKGKCYIHSSWMNVSQIGDEPSSKWNAGINTFYVTRSNSSNTRPPLPFKKPNPPRLIKRTHNSLSLETDPFQGADTYRFYYGMAKNEPQYSFSTSLTPQCTIYCGGAIRYSLYVRTVDSNWVESPKSLTAYATTLPENMKSIIVKNKTQDSVTVGLLGRCGVGSDVHESGVTRDRVIDVYVSTNVDTYYKSIIINGNGSSTSEQIVTLTGMPTNGKYKLVFRGRATTNGTYLYSAQSVHVEVSSEKFEWDTPKDSGFSTTATYDDTMKKWKAPMVGAKEWNRLCQYINSKRTVNYNFTTAGQGSMFTSSMFNQVISAIQGAGGANLPSPKSIGNPTSYNDLNKLVDSINNVT